MGRVVLTLSPSPRDAIVWDRDISGPDPFIGSLLADPKLDLSAPLYPAPIWGLGPLGISGIPRGDCFIETIETRGTCDKVLV